MNTIFVALRVTVVTLVLTGLLYPLVSTGLARALFPRQASGSLVTDRRGSVVGSELLAQAFTKPAYFQPRPSAAGTGYDATSSGGTNLGPTSQKLNDAVKAAVAAYRTANGLAAGAEVPADAVTSSASGLDPHVSPANAQLQAARVAKARGLPVERVMGFVAAATEGRDLGVLGEPGVNVLRLNVALDAASAPPAAGK